VVAGIGVVLLRFVAAYCLLDTFNLILVATLTAAGDTRRVFRISIVMYSGFVAALVLADHLRIGLMAEWWMATFFIMTTAMVWIVRIRSTAWHNIEVVEPVME
jgi:MATE family multidrug resistance protein